MFAAVSQPNPCSTRGGPLSCVVLGVVSHWRREPEPEHRSGEGTPVSPAPAVLRDPGSDSRADLTFVTELWVYYGLDGSAAGRGALREPP